MKFTTREDVEAPIDRVFDMICDFDNYERAAMRRGAEVRRTDNLTESGTGMCWEAAFDMRGKRRDVVIEMKKFDAPNELGVFTESTGLEGIGQIELMALARNRTRVSVEFEIKPTNLSARLLVQSLKLAKTSLTKRFKLRAAQYAKGLEDRYKANN